MDAPLADEVRGLLDDLFAAPDEQNRYRLTLLKKLSQSTKPTRIKESIADFDTLKVLYGQLEDILSVLDLGAGGIRYFAGSVLKSRMFQLQQRSEADRYIHAAAFVAHQFFRAQDNLIDLWLSVMASFQNTASREHKERLLQNRKDQQKQIKIIIDGLDVSVFGMIHEIRSVASAANLSDTQKVLAIQSLLDREHTKDFDRLKADLEKTTHDRDWYDILEARSLRLQNRLTPILKVLNFELHGRAEHLMAAITHFRKKEGKIAEHAPMEFLSAEERGVLSRDDGTFRPSLYKVFLFQHVTDAIK